jgi:hypothetical protein
MGAVSDDCVGVPSTAPTNFRYDFPGVARQGRVDRESTDFQPNGGRMFRLAIAAVLFFFSTLALAQAPNFGELKSKNPVQLTADEMQQLIPGASIVSYTNAGSRRQWTNKADGTLTASSDGRGVNGGRGRPASAGGTWKLDGTGKWCVRIEWTAALDDWCRYLFKADGKYYAYSRLEDNAVGSEFEISH